MTQDEHIAHAAEQLDDKNITDLWLTVSLVSLTEYFGAELSDRSGINPLFPLLNMKVVSLFGDAILRSTACEHGQELFRASDLAPVLNPLLRAEDAGALDKAIEDPEERLLHWISVLGGSQFRFQSNDLGARIARGYAMLDVLPRTHREQLEEKHGDHFIHLPGEFAERFGLSVRAYFLIAFRLFVFYKTRHDDLGLSDQIWTHLAGVARDTAEGQELLNALMADLVDQGKKAYRHLITNPGRLLLKDDLLSEAEFSTFFDLVARDTDALRRVHRSRAARMGYYGHRLSPLEMFPVVQLPSHQRRDLFVVPDFRKLHVAVTQVPHFALMKEFPGNEYNEVRGSLQEMYIQDLTRSRLARAMVIPERVYGKEHTHGPDLTVVDRSTDGLVCIESKAKRMRVETKTNPMSSELLSDLRSGLKALQQLPEKIEALYAGLSEYKDVQRDLDATRPTPPICVIVLGEGIFSLPHVMARLLDSQPDHFIHDFPFPFCVMSLDVYERAVEVSAANNASFYQTLHGYWADSMDRGPKKHAAEDFKGLPIDTENWYLGTYRDMLLARGRA